MILILDDHLGGKQRLVYEILIAEKQNDIAVCQVMSYNNYIENNLIICDEKRGIKFESVNIFKLRVGVANSTNIDPLAARFTRDMEDKNGRSETEKF